MSTEELRKGYIPEDLWKQAFDEVTHSSTGLEGYLFILTPRKLKVITTMNQRNMPGDPDHTWASLKDIETGRNDDFVMARLPGTHDENFGVLIPGTVLTVTCGRVLPFPYYLGVYKHFRIHEYINITKFERR